MNKTFGCALVLGLAAIASPMTAAACGGCFAPPETQQVVTDHRMVMAIHASESILWDQFRFTGRPQDFSWVLPVRGMVNIELASGDFFDLLDASTAPQVFPPQISCPSSGGFLSATGASARNAAEDSGGGVQVISTAIVGPYETVTIRSTDADALTTWLREHSYTVPVQMEPVIRWYNDMHMDFVALRLRPEEGIQAMQPVRVRFSTPSPVLPLRMVAGGVGDKVGISLFVFGEGRWEAQNFPNGTINADDLVWTFNAGGTGGTSNYPQVFANTVASLQGRGWITESASTASMVSYQFNGRMTAMEDFRLATQGLSNPWITRLRTDLRARDLDRDLQLAASTTNTVVDRTIQVTHAVNQRRCASDDGFYSGTDTGRTGGLECATRPGASHGAGATLAAGVALAGLAAARRRRRNG